MPVVRISLTLSRHLSLLSIVPSMSSLLHPVPVQSCFRPVPAGHPTLAHLCEGVYKSTSLLSSLLLLGSGMSCSASLGDFRDTRMIK